MQCLPRILALFTLTLLLVSSAQAIGVSPSRLEIEHAQRGDSIPKELVLSGIPSGTSVTTTITGEAAKWLRLQQTKYVFPNETNLQIPLMITIPSDAPNGNYSANIRFSIAAQKEEHEQQVALISGVHVRLHIQVSGEQQKNYEFVMIRIDTAYEEEPLHIEIIVNNKGDVRPNLYAAITIDNPSKRETLIQSEPLPLANLQPRIQSTSTILFDHNQRHGVYLAKVTLREDNRVVKEYIEHISVLPKRAKPSPMNLLHISIVVQQNNLIIRGLIENTGEKTAPTSLFAQLTNEQGHIMTITGEEVIIPKGHTEVASITIHDLTSGTYDIRAWLSGEHVEDATHQSIAIIPPSHITGYSIRDLSSIEITIGNMTITSGTIAILLLLLLLTKQVYNRITVHKKK
jgi:hypothetical protein